MIGRILVLLVVGFSIAVAPTATADEVVDDSSGDCVSTSHEKGGGVDARVNPGSCVDGD